MTTAIDPYHDEDAAGGGFEVEFTAALNESNNQTPIKKTFNQIGDVFKHGGFCSPRNEEIKATKKNDSTSHSDESLQTDDGKKEKSVTFGETTEALIVPEETTEALIVPEETTEALIVPETSIKEPLKSDLTMENEERSCSTIKPGKVIDNNSTSMFSSTLALCMFSSAVIAVSIMSKNELLFTAQHKDFMNEKLDVLGVEPRHLVSGIGGLIGVMATIKTASSFQKTPKAIVEFIWGVGVYGLVFAGVFHTYGYVQA